MKTLVLFNAKGGVGKTTLAYHLGHMLARLGLPTLAVDLDPQANLTSAFFDEDFLERLWEHEEETVLAAINPILEGAGDITATRPITIGDRLALVAGDLGLARFEDRLSAAWPGGSQNDQAALRVTSAFHRLIQDAGEKTGAVVAIMDLGPNLGAINRAALLAADFLVVPLAADASSLLGLHDLGLTVRTWQQDWHQVLRLASTSFPLPAGTLEPIGYVVMQQVVRLDRPSRHSAKWMDRIPAVYREAVLGRADASIPIPDPANLATLRSYRGLMPMAQEARRPMFDLKPAHGAIGSHAALVRTCYQEFAQLARRVAEACGLEPRSPANGSP
jgi:cellulose biosynthesis protein BcsQ